MQFPNMFLDSGSGAFAPSRNDSGEVLDGRGILTFLSPCGRGLRRDRVDPGLISCCVATAHSSARLAARL